MSTSSLRAAAYAATLTAATMALVMPQAAIPQEPNYDFSNVLAPGYDAAPDYDILGLELGMTMPETIQILGDRGFTIKQKRFERTARGRGAMRYFDADRERSEEHPAYEQITVYFDFSEKPRVLAVYRNSTYGRSSKPAYTNVMQSIEAKYGDAPVWDTRNNEVMAAWYPKSLARKCGPMKHNLRYFRAPEDIEQYEGCFRGLAIKVGYDRHSTGRPVEYTRSFLVDTRLMDANYKETWRLAEEQAAQRERREREKTYSNDTAEF